MPDLPALRELIRQQMLDNGGGAIPETYSDAARSIGISQPSIFVFLNEEGRGMDIGTAIRVARYLSMPAATILRMAGHDEIADMIAVPDEPEEDAHMLQVRRLLADLEPPERTTLISTMRSIKRQLRPHHLPPVTP